MLRDLVRVLRVDPWKTATPSVTGYTISGETVEETPRFVQFQTVNDWKASVCSVAAQRQRWVWIGSRDTKYGLDIVTAELDQTKFQHEDKAAS